MSILTLTIPAPCDWLNSNQRLHRMVSAARIRAWREATRAALSRTDLGRGWASPEVVERARLILRRDGTSEDCKRVVADLDALLKKGGG